MWNDAPGDMQLFDFGDESDAKSAEKQSLLKDTPEGTQTDKLIGIDDDGAGGDTLSRTLSHRRQNEEDLLASANAAELLENLLGGLNESDQSPETENAQDALDLGLGLFSPTSAATAGATGSSTSTAAEGKEASSSSNSRLSLASLSLLGKSSAQSE